MAPHVIVSYDGTASDRDALELGRLFHALGAPLTLAYVRHAIQADPDREALADHDARTLLADGAARLDDPLVEQQIVVSRSTSEGLGDLAVRSGAAVIAFGSDYRTPTGRVAIGPTAQTLLENGPAALALAPAGYRAGDLRAIGVLPGTDDEGAIETAYAIGERHGAEVRTTSDGVDLLLVGSRPEAPSGRVMISASASLAIEQARAPVLVLARASALTFETVLTV